jgi:hypothetical protein
MSNMNEEILSRVHKALRMTCPHYGTVYPVCQECMATRITNALDTMRAYMAQVTATGVALEASLKRLEGKR